jgi:hypothetical protein
MFHGLHRRRDPRAPARTSAEIRACSSPPPHQLLQHRQHLACLTSLAGRLACLGAAPAMLQPRSLASLKPSGRDRAIATAAVHPASAVRHRRACAGCASPSPGTAPRRRSGNLGLSTWALRMGTIAHFGCLPGVTVPATTAWPPSDTATCCTTTVCFPPFRSRSRVSAPR